MAFRVSHQRDAERALAEMVDAVNRGAYVPKTRPTVRQFAAEWLAAIEPTVRPATHFNYARNLRLHVERYIGSAPLVSVDARTQQPLCTATRGRAEGPEGRRTVAEVGASRSRGRTQDAAGRGQVGRLVRNPADAADPPRQASTHAEMTTWNAAETARFLTGRQGNRLGAAFLMLATTGARRGEVLGLRWVEVDLDARRAAIRQTVITSATNRR